MNWHGCSRSGEVREALSQGRWPDACAPDLRAHVEACNDCANEVLVTSHLRRARAEAVHAARPGAANLLWLKAQAQRRNAALERVGRPLAAAQAFAFAVVLLAIVGIVASHWQTIADRALTAQDPSAWSFTALLGDWGLASIVIAVSVVMILGGLAVYLTTERQ
jgi:anti-sigma factor RsiW